MPAAATLVSSSGRAVTALLKMISRIEIFDPGVEVDGRILR